MADTLVNLSPAARQYALPMDVLGYRMVASPSERDLASQSNRAIRVPESTARLVTAKWQIYVLNHGVMLFVS